MKKHMLIALITVFALVSLGSLCSADSRRGITNTSKKGSLLIYPLVKVGATSEDSNDTIITISNDYPAKVHIFCQYNIPEDCSCDTSFDFTLTANQSIAFSAKTGYGLSDEDLISKWKIDILPFPTDGGQYAGDLRCWAVDSSNYPISWNHLAGTAIISEGLNRTWQYSAWRFAVGWGVERGDHPRDATGAISKVLRLTGMPNTYDACPEALIFNFIKQVDPTLQNFGNLANNRLTLVPCKQDCVEVGSTPVHAYFSRYDEYENSAYAHACYDCDDNASAFYDKSLSPRSGKFYPNASSNAFTNLATPSGMAVVTNTPSGAHCGANFGIPLVGVISNEFDSPTGPIAGETLTTRGRGQPEYTIYNGTELGQRSGIEVQMKY